MPGGKILDKISPLFFIEVFYNSLLLSVMHKSVAIQSGNIANNRKVYDTQKEKTGKDSMKQEKKIDEKLNISNHSTVRIIH